MKIKTTINILPTIKKLLKYNIIKYLFIFLIFISPLFISKVFINDNFLFMCGEYQYSYNYSNLLDNIFKNIDFSNPYTLFSCPRCDSIYPYSWLFSLVYYTYLNLGSLFGFNNFIFNLYIGILLQIISLYFLLKFGLNQKKINIPFLLLSSTFFIFTNYKSTLFCSGTSYEVNHAVVVLMVTTYLYIINNIGKFTFKNYLYLTVILNTFFMIMISITINYLPIFLYLTFIIFLLNIKRVLHNLPRYLILFASSFTLLIAFNYQWLINLKYFTNTKSFNLPVNHELFLDAFTGRYLMYPLNNYFIYLMTIFLFVVFFYNFRIFFAKTSKIFVAYLLTVILLMGNNFYYDFYLFIFNNLPLMSTIRSSHRFYAIIYLLQFILIYRFLLNIYTQKLKFYKIILVIVSILAIFNFNNYFITLDKISFKTNIPNEYNLVNDFVNSSKSSFLYVPFFDNHIINNYKWTITNNEKINPYIYNPIFKSLYFNENILNIYDWYNVPTNKYHFNRLANYYNLKDSFNNKFSHPIFNLKVDYIIFDKNYLNINNYSYILESKNIILEKSFGNIDIYSVNKINCVDYFGDINTTIGNCFNYESRFINSDEEDNESFNKIPYIYFGRLEFEKDENIYINHIYNNHSREILSENNLLFSPNTVEVYNKTIPSYIATIDTKYDYLLFQYLALPNTKNELFLYNGIETDTYILEQTDNTDLNFEIIDLSKYKGNKINVFYKGDYILLIKPILLTNEEYNLYL